jgi:hypothetical protein
MVFGELVDTVPMFGSQRKPYILIGALLMATGLLILAGVERLINDYRGRFGRRFRICCCPRRW